MIGKLNFIYQQIHNLHPTVKTIIIVVLTLIMAIIGFLDYPNYILNSYSEHILQEKLLAEEYTRIVSPAINSHIERILLQDKDASNIILLNYHNTLVSTHGLSYRYLTSLVEKKRGLDTKCNMRVWKELEYVHYGEEIERINRNNYLRVDSLEQYDKRLPNITDLLRNSKAESAAFYPLLGIDGPIGMLVIIYPIKKEYYLGYYQSVIAPSLQPLTTWLDYNSVKDKFKKLYGQGKIKPEYLLK